jgi:hypothetical protein
MTRDTPKVNVSCKLISIHLGIVNHWPPPTKGDRAQKYIRQVTRETIRDFWHGLLRSAGKVIPKEVKDVKYATCLLEKSPSPHSSMRLTLNRRVCMGVNNFDTLSDFLDHENMIPEKINWMTATRH